MHIIKKIDKDFIIMMPKGEMKYLKRKVDSLILFFVGVINIKFIFFTIINTKQSKYKLPFEELICTYSSWTVYDQ